MYGRAVGESLRCRDEMSASAPPIFKVIKLRQLLIEGASWRRRSRIPIATSALVTAVWFAFQQWLSRRLLLFAGRANNLTPCHAFASCASLAIDAGLPAMQFNFDLRKLRDTFERSNEVGRSDS